MNQIYRVQSETEQNALSSSLLLLLLLLLVCVTTMFSILRLSRGNCLTRAARSIVAGCGRQGLPCLRSALSFSTMVRDTSSKSWAPGDAILFGGSREPSSSNSTKKTTTTRQPLATLKPAKQARQQEEAVQHQRVKKGEKQTTLSPWAKAPWQPGMRVQIATQASTSTLIDGRGPVANNSKGKQREACTNEVHMHSTG
jgi:hypothetical protein